MSEWFEIKTDLVCGERVYKMRYRGYCINIRPLQDRLACVDLEHAMRKLAYAYNKSMEAKSFDVPFKCERE